MLLPPLHNKGFINYGGEVNIEILELGPVSNERSGIREYLNLFIYIKIIFIWVGV